jgi:hypothetical protein
MSDMPAGQFHHFGDLPVELKLEILRYHLCASKSIRAHTYRYTYAKSYLAIARVSQDLYKLSTEVSFYRENKFLIVPQRTSCPKCIKAETFFPPSVVNASQIRKLEFEIMLDRHWIENFFPLGSDHPELAQLCALACPRNTPYSQPGHIVSSALSNLIPRKTSWQNNFTSLKVLRIVVGLSQCLHQKTVKALEELPAYEEIDLQAKRVQVVLFGHRKRSGKPLCGGRCATVIERVVAGMTEPQDK